MDFRLQCDDYSCGPVALINAYKYIYGEFPKITLRKLLNECETDPIKDGTHRWNMIDSSLSNVIVRKPTYTINKILKYEAFVLLYSFNDEDAHYIFVVNCKDGTYNFYNYIHDNKYVNVKVTKDYFVDNVLKYNPKINGLDYPLAWKINK